MTYAVKELYYTLQGEGARAGGGAVFCRFAGCNLWSGREQDRAEAVCSFCDTDFIGTDGPGGGSFATATDLAQAVATAWPGSRRAQAWVVCTGGEPLLQIDPELVTAFHHRGISVAVETNGTVAAPPGLDWICVSPKAGSELILDHGNELKLVYPQAGAPPEDFENLDFHHFSLQPMDGPKREQNTRAAIDYCRAHPHWRLSLQIHKYIGIP